MENRESKDNEARLEKDVAGADDAALMWEEVKRGDCLGTLLYIQPQRLRGNSSVG